ncbi:MAG TPA: hypothetical protein VE291_10230 [Terracidiphilus sp.]|jgi:hypothetical protein|nr:hypothetical protein [Terracidiphilus sp.]
MPTFAAPLRVPCIDEEARLREISTSRPRRIDREAGRALEILGHAIEYLADEYAHAGGPGTADDPQVRAMQILMARNREIYLACPVAPTLAKRLLGWLQTRTVDPASE